MGKYMRKTKTHGDIAVMEVTQSSLGVRTRAKTLALQRLHNSASDPDSASYLQLRNRRLQKPPHHSPKRQRQRQNPRPGSAGDHLHGENVQKVVVGQTEETNEDCCNNKSDLGMEASFGENVLEVEGRERGIRESTPCDLVRDPDIIRTPGSTTRSSGLTDANRRVHNLVHRGMPSANELDEFFATAEKEQQKSFMEKYNFDPMTDKPLPGRFEWEKMDP